VDVYELVLESIIPILRPTGIKNAANKRNPVDCETPIIEIIRTAIITGITILIPNLKITLLEIMQASIELTNSPVFNTPIYSSRKFISARISGQAAPKILFGKPMAIKEI
jgi:hypothetical protein